MNETVGWRHFRVKQLQKKGKGMAFALMQASCDPNAHVWVGDTLDLMCIKKGLESYLKTLCPLNWSFHFGINCLLSSYKVIANLSCNQR